MVSNIYRLILGRTGERTLILTTYFVAKFVAIVLMLYLIPVLIDRSLFFYPDLSIGSYGSCSLGTPNYLYVMTTCVLGINDIGDPNAIIVSGILNTLRDLVIIGYALQHLNIRQVLLLVLFLGLNPYLSYNHIRLTTDLFGALGLLQIFHYAYKSIPVDRWFLIGGCFLVGCRNALLFPYLVFLAFCLYDALKTRDFHRVLFPLITAVLMMSMTFYWGGKTYASLLVPGLSYGPFSFTSLYGYFDAYFSNIVSMVLTSIGLLFSHLLLLLGFREEVAGIGVSSFLGHGLVYDSFQLSFAILMFVSNLIISYGFIRHFFSQNRMCLIIIMYVIPSFLIVAHLRYFYPLIPILVYGFCLYVRDSQRVRHGDGTA